VAIGEGRWDNKWRDLAAVLEGLPRAPRLDDERSVAGRVCPGSTSAGSCAFASADAIGFTIPVATANSSTRWGPRVDRRRVSVATGSSVSLSRINCRLGE